MLELRDVDRVDEKADHDGRRGEQDIVDKARASRKPAALAVLGQVRAGEDPDRRSDERSRGRHEKTADDRIQETTAASRRRRVFGEQRRTYRMYTCGGERPQDP